MEMKTKISLDALNTKSVTVKTQRYIEENNENINVGDLHAKAYVNSERGREELHREVADPFLTAIMAVWGDVPAVEEEIMEDPDTEI